MAIGGYFEWHFEVKSKIIHNGLYLNSGRSAFELFLLGNKPKKIYLPEYICDSLFDVFSRVDTKLVFYSVSDDLYPLIDNKVLDDPDSYVLIVNYFGVRDDVLLKFSRWNHKILWDLSQALFLKLKKGQNGFYSPRKFFGVPDGGILVGNCTDKLSGFKLEKSTSFQKCAHLLKRIDLSAEEGYNDFSNSSKLIMEEKLKSMSTLTTTFLKSINYKSSWKQRSANFSFYHKKLQNFNLLSIDKKNCKSPLVYPLKLSKVKSEEIRNVLISQKVYIPKYWPNVSKWANPNGNALELSNSILPLPVDQRYSEAECNEVVEMILKHI